MSLLSLQDAIELRKGKRLVFTNGVFDILHAGHVRLLQKAETLGDLLIVGINSDDSVRLLGKGPDRPINPLGDRAVVLAALSCVDAVVSFSEQTPLALIEALKPEVHVKGGDYQADALPEAPVVRSYGGEIVILPLLEGRSTTRLVDKLR